MCIWLDTKVFYVVAIEFILVARLYSISQLTTGIRENTRRGDHMFQPEFIGARDIIQVKKPRFWEPLLNELFFWASRGVGHVPACIECNDF